MYMYKDRYFSIMGDSISALEGFIPAGYAHYYGREMEFLTGIHSWKDMWWGQVLCHFGGRLLVNNAWSGSYVTKAESCQVLSYGCSDARCGALAADGVTPDHIFVFIGSNDRGACFPLSSKDKTDLRVIENAYGLMLDKIKRNYPLAQIWCFTLLKTTCSLEPEFVFPNRQQGYPMEDYGELISKAARQRECHVIDLFHCEGLCDTVDRLHPNYAGMQWIAKNVIAAMEKV